MVIFYRTYLLFPREIAQRIQMDFDELLGRLLITLRTRVQNGEITERGLARMTGISQPHMHNVLKGKRILSLRAADRIFREAQLGVCDLIASAEFTECSYGGCRCADRRIGEPAKGLYTRLEKPSGA
jgi:hypothetical protein